MNVYLGVLEEPYRQGVDQDVIDSLEVFVGYDGEAAMVHEPKRRALLRTRCRPLAADDLAEVMQAVERLERSVVAERKYIRPGCREWTNIVLRDDARLRKFNYCGTPPAEIIRFVEEISVPLGRRLGEELSVGLAATAPWASPAPLEAPGV